MQELKIKDAVRLDEVIRRTVRVFLHSSFFEITGTWQWEMETEAVFCSDVMFSFPADFTGTKAIFHPDDVEAVTAGLTANEKIPSLRFRIITTYGEVKTLHGENLLVHQEEEARVEEEMLQATMAEQAQKAAQHHLGIVADVVEKSSQLSASGAWYYNRASGIAWYSDFVYHLHGIPAQGLNAHLHTFYPFIHPDDALFATEFMERAFAGQVPLHIDYRILVGDDVRWVSYKAHWFFSNKGEPILGGIFQDITAHKSVEKELESFRSLVQFQRQQLLYDEQQINFGHWQISLLTRKTTYSDQYYRIFGLKPGALAPTTAAFLNYVHPEDRDRVEAAFKKIIYEHELSELEYRILRNDGKTRFILQRAKLITYEGEMIISGVIQDITVQRMLEKKQAGLQETIWQQNMLAQQAAEMANLFSWIIDLEEGAYHWSESFFRLMGFTKVQPQNITEKTLFSIIHPHDAKAFRTHWQKAVQQKEPAAFDFRVMQRGMVTNMKAVFSFHTNNDKTYFIGTVQNNTTEHVLQQQLSQRVQLAESLTENMIDRVMITDSDNTIMLWNAACEKAYGIKRLEAIGENFFDVFPQLKTEEEMRMFQRVHRGEKVVEEGRLSGTGNGYYNMSLMPVFQGGEVTGILHIIHDATDEVNLRKSLAQRLQLIESIVQSSVDRIIALDRNMNYLYWNKAAEEYYGLNKEAVLGKNILEVFPQLINDPSYGEIRRALRGEKIHISINPERQKYFETYLVPIKDDRGEVNTLLWMAHDLSKEWKLKEAQRRIQAKVEEEHRRLKEAQAIGHLGSFEWTVGDTVSFWSDELYRINGLEPQSEVITPEKVEQFIYPADAGRLQEIKERSLRQPGEYSHVHRIVRRDGEVRWVNHQWESIPDEEDKVIKVIGIVQDITEQVLAEEKLQSNDALLRSAEAVALTGSYEAELATMTFRFSDGMYRLFGEELQSFEPTMEFIDSRSHPDDVEAVRIILEEAAANKQPYHYIRRIYRKDGEMRTVEAHGKVICDAAGNAAKFVGLVQDITDRKKADEEIHRLKDEIAQKATDKYLALFNSIDEGFYLAEVIFDENGRPVDILYHEENPSAVRILGATVKGKKLTEVSPDYEPYWYEIFGSVALTGESKRLEQYAQVDRKWFDFYVTKIGDEASRQIAIVFQDITGLKNTQLELEQSRALLQSVFNVTYNGLSVLESVRNEAGELVDMRYLFANEATKKVNKRYDLEGQLYSEVHAGFRGTDYHEVVKRVIETGETHQYQLRYNFEHLDNWFNITTVKLGDGVVVSFEDISEIKKAEFILRESEERKAFLLKLSDAIRPLSNPDEIQAVATSIVMNYFGADRCYYCEIEGDMSIIRQDAAKEGLPSVAASYPLSTMPIFKAVLDAGEPFVVEDSNTTDLMDEGLRQLCIQMQILSYVDVPVIKSGQPAGILCLTQCTPRTWTATEVELVEEIAERIWAAVERAKAAEALQQSEERLQKAISIETVGVIFFDLDGRINDANIAFELMSGFAKDDFITGKVHWDQLTPPEYLDVTLKSKEEFLTKGQNTPYEKQYVRPDGSRWWGLFAGRRLSENECVEFVIDITEQKETEQRIKEFNAVLEQQVSERVADLRESKEFIEEIMQTTPDLVTIYNTATDEMIYTNHKDIWESHYKEAAEKAYKMKDEDRAEAIVHPDDVEKAKAYLQARRLLSDGEVQVVDLRMQGDKYIRIRSSVFKRGEAGEALEIISFTSDITAYKNAELEVQKNVSILKQAEDIAAIGSWEYQIPSGRFSWSDGMYRIFDYPMGAPVQPEMYVHHAIEEDRSVARRIIKNLKKGHGPFEETLRIRREDGVRTLKVKATMECNKEGTPQRMIGVDMDITEINEAQKKLEESQHWLKQTAEASPDAINVYDLRKKQPVYLNNCLAEWTGRTLDELVNMGIEGRLQLIHRDDRLNLLHFNEKIAMAKDGDVMTLEYRIETKQQEMRWIRNRSKVFQRDAAGKVTHILSILQDVSEEKAAESLLRDLNTSLEKQNKELENKNDEITSFAFVASHDLKEPIRKIHTFSDWLLHREKNLSNAGQQNLLRLSNSVKRLDTLVEDIVALTKVHTEKEDLHEVKLDEALSRAREEMQEMIERTGAEIMAGPLPTVKGIENHLVYLFKNLLSNSIKFQKPGNKPVIQIVGERMEGLVKVTITDNGIGFSPEYSKRIFQMFRRLHGKTEFEGTGMGLAICKRIMEKHGGNVTADAEVDKGATFTCWFPG